MPDFLMMIVTSLKQRVNWMGHWKAGTCQFVQSPYHFIKVIGIDYIFLFDCKSHSDMVIHHVTVSGFWASYCCHWEVKYTLDGLSITGSTQMRQTFTASSESPVDLTLTHHCTMVTLNSDKFSCLCLYQSSCFSFTVTELSQLQRLWWEQV